MSIYTEKQRELPVKHTTDVLVIGGGPSGIAAAIAAARAGAKTMIVERYGSFGGVITQVGVEAVAWYRHEGLVNEAEGLLFEMEDTANRMGAARKECQSDSMALDTELFKYVCDTMVLDAGVDVLFHTYVVDAIVEHGIVTGVITESKSGREAIMAKRVVDCTGDGDIIEYSGAFFNKAPKKELMAVTSLFSCKGVDCEKFMSYVLNDLKPTYKDWGGNAWKQESDGKTDDMFSPFIERPFVDAIKNGELVIEDEFVTIGGTWSSLTEYGEVTQLNLVFMRNIDCTDATELTRAELMGRRYCMKALDILRKKVPGFENAVISRFSTTLGTRESRLLDGEYTITKEDVFSQGRFDDAVAMFPEFIDGRSYLILPTTGRYYQIPYRALKPKNIDNLLVAGRCISGEPVAHTSFRNMACCIATGQAAGIAAAISIQDGVTTGDVSVSKVQAELKNQHVQLTGRSSNLT